MRKEDALSDADWANAKKLTLSSLTLTAIPKALLGAVHLTSLVLDGCSLMTLPDELFALPNVKKMSFKQNFISEIGLQGILNSGKKLSSVAMDKNPLAFPPPAVMAKSWSSVRKWAAANSSYMVYRLLWGSNYVDVTLSGMSDPQTREKVEKQKVLLFCVFIFFVCFRMKIAVALLLVFWKVRLIFPSQLLSITKVRV